MILLSSFPKFMVTPEHRARLVYMSQIGDTRRGCDAPPGACLTNRDLLQRIWLEKNCRETSARNLYLQPNYIDPSRLLDSESHRKETGGNTTVDRSRSSGRDT